MSRSDSSADEVDAHVGRRLRSRRMALGIGQEQLGAELGLTFQQMQKYEKAQNRISVGRLYNLSMILSVPVGYFFQGLSHDRPVDEQGLAPSGVEMHSFLASPEVAGADGGIHAALDPARGSASSTS
jgi:transcriptional regulator with XRE-family HTH domain